MTQLAKKYIFMLCIFTFLFSCLFNPEIIYAEDLSYELSSTIIPVVEDKADLFSDYDEVIIHDKFTQLRDKTGHQFVFMTVTDTTNYIKGREIEAMFNQSSGELYGNGSVFFLISTDEDNLICDVMAFSYAQDYLPQETCEYISNKLRPYAENGNYTECMDAFFEYFNQAFEGTLNIENITAESKSAVMSFITDNGLLLIIILFSSVVITLIIFFGFSRKIQNNSETYSTKPFIGSHDTQSNLTTDKLTYIRSRVSK